jgi:uncharacterized protein
VSGADGVQPTGDTDRRWLVVSLHDVAPSTATECSEWLERLEGRGLAVSLLVVPGPWRRSSGLRHDGALAEWLKAAQVRGHEIVQHGWEHAAPPWATLRRGPRARAVGRLVSRGCGEFWSIDAEEAMRRLTAGRRALEHAGIHAEGFIAPAWLMSAAASEAVRLAGFRYTTTHRHVIDLAAGRVVPCLALSQRPGDAFTGVAAYASLAGARRAVRRGAPLRLAVHPDDIRSSRAMASVLRACEAALAAGYRSLTYGRLLDDAAAGASVTGMERAS